MKTIEQLRREAEIHAHRAAHKMLGELALVAPDDAVAQTRIAFRALFSMHMHGVDAGRDGVL